MQSWKIPRYEWLPVPGVVEVCRGGATCVNHFLFLPYNNRCRNWHWCVVICRNFVFPFFPTTTAYRTSAMAYHNGWYLSGQVKSVRCLVHPSDHLLIWVHRATWWEFIATAGIRTCGLEDTIQMLCIGIWDWSGLLIYFLIFSIYTICNIDVIF